MKKEYVLGFILDIEKENVLLIRKNRPEMLAGKLNGIGGSVEEGESFINAMQRETKEEADIFLETKEFKSIGQIEDMKDEFVVYVFAAKTDIMLFKTLTDEKVDIYNINDVIQREDLCKNVDQVLISLLKSKDI